MRYDADYCTTCNSYLCFEPTADAYLAQPDCRRGEDPDYDPYWEPLA